MPKINANGRPSDENADSTVTNAVGEQFELSTDGEPEQEPEQPQPVDAPAEQEDAKPKKAAAPAKK